MLRTLCILVLAVIVFLSVTDAFVIYRTYARPMYYRTYRAPIYYHGDMDDVDRYYIVGQYMYIN